MQVCALACFNSHLVRVYMSVSALRLPGSMVVQSLEDGLLEAWAGMYTSVDSTLHSVPADEEKDDLVRAAGGSIQLLT